MKVYKVVPLSDALIFGGILAASLAGVGYAFTRGPVHAWVTALLVLAGVVFATVERFIARLAHARSIAAYTAQGTQVIPGPCADRWGSGLLSPVSECVDDVIAFWGRRYPHREIAIAEAFDGAAIVLTDQPIRPPGRAGMAVGITVGTTLRVMWRPSDTMQDLLQRIRHEASHLALFAVGIDNGDDEHHEIMHREGLNA